MDITIRDVVSIEIEETAQGTVASDRYWRDIVITDKNGTTHTVTLYARDDEDNLKITL